MKHLMMVGAVLGGLSTALVPALAQNWTATSAPSTNWSCVASSADGRKLAAAVNGGLVYTSTNSGATWMATGAPSNGWSCIASSADGSKLVAGGLGLIYTSTNSGATWVGGPDGWCNSLASSADGTKLAAAGVGLLRVSTDSGATWMWLGPTNGYPVSFSITLVSSSADGNELAVVEGWDQGPPSRIYPTPSSVWAPQYPQQYFGLCTSVAISAEGTRIAATVNNDDFFDPAPTNCAGFLYDSSNSGATSITNCTSVSTWTSVASSADGTRLAAVASGGAIATSTDAGATWTTASVTNANWSAVASSADGAKLVAVAVGGGIYTWQTTPAPALNIAATSNGFVISWVIPSMNFVLQQNSSLGPADWTNVATPPVLNLTNLQNQVTLPPHSGPTFYRLKSLAP